MHAVGSAADISASQCGVEKVYNTYLSIMQHICVLNDFDKSFFYCRVKGEHVRKPTLKDQSTHACSLKISQHSKVSLGAMAAASCSEKDLSHDVHEWRRKCGQLSIHLHPLRIVSRHRRGEATARPMT